MDVEEMQHEMVNKKIEENNPQNNLNSKQKQKALIHSKYVFHIEYIVK